MKTTMIAQIATLAFAFSVTASPLIPRQVAASNRDLNFAAVNAREVAGPAPAIKRQEATSAKTKKTKTTKTKTSKTKTAKTSAIATDDSDAPATSVDSDVPAETSAAPTPSGGGGDEEAPSATITSGASLPTETGAAPGGGSGGGAFPAAKGTSVLKAVQTIAAGQSFDGGMVQFDRGVSCSGQAEGGNSDAVFILEEGASISNVIIGPNQIEGIHCNGGCSVSNVWWDAVCEDAFTVKLQAAGQITTIKGGGAKGAADKVVQHNGAGTISISDFVVEDFGKLYRACGNCAESHERHVIMDGITASSGKMLAGINTNFGDTAKITNSKLSNVKSTCTRFEGVAKGSEPKEIGSGADGKSCIFGADVVGGV